MTPAQYAPQTIPRAALRGAGRGAAADRDGWLGLAHKILLYMLLEFTYIGLTPFSEASVSERVEGSPLVRFVAIGMFALSLLIIFARRAETLRCIRDNWKFFLVLAVCLLSTLWSQYPDLTIRRAFLFLCISFAGLGVAVSVVDLRLFHTRLFGFLTFVIVLNLAVTTLFPAQAISDIGVKGLYTQKNMAGLVAMVAVIVAVTWAFGCKTMLGQLLAIGSAVLSSFFLVITLSKTSVGLLVVTLGFGFMFWVAQRLGPRFAILAMAAGALVVAGILGTFIFNDFEWSKVLTTYVSDPTFTGRDELWAFAYKSAMKHPLLGHGYGAFWDVGAVNDPLAKLEPGTWLGDVDTGVINQAHNGYLELALHIGFPAMLCAVWAVISGVKAATRRAIESPMLSARPAFAMIALILFVHVLHNFTEATLFMRSNPFANLVSMLIFLSTFGVMRRPPRRAA
jgi:O-antigen ligase